MRTARQRATASTVGGVALLVVLFGAAACGSDGDTPTTTTTTTADSTTTTEEESSDTTEAASGGDLIVPTADVGDCVTNQVTASVVSEFDVVDCDEPHQAELFHAFDLPEGDGEFPGDEELNTIIEEECTGDAFDDYVGEPYATSEIFVAPVAPTQETWDEADDREVLCFGHLQDGSDLTESFEGSGR